MLPQGSRQSKDHAAFRRQHRCPVTRTPEALKIGASLARLTENFGVSSWIFPVNPPVLPMLAKRVSELPAGEGWIFEPKWDGFRALVFRDGDEVFIQSRDGKPLVRYYPELVEPLKAQLPPRCVLDGEIVIVRPEGLDFEALQLRLHPAASRVRMLSQ